MAESDYGSTITFGGVAVGKCQVIDFPELATAKINATHHGSGGWSEAIPSGLIEVGDITLMILMENGKLDTYVDHMLAKDVDTVVIANEVDTMTGEGFFLSVKEEPADATAPNAIRASVVITYTGALTINTTS